MKMLWKWEASADGRKTITYIILDVLNLHYCQEGAGVGLSTRHGLQEFLHYLAAYADRQTSDENEFLQATS